MAYIGREPQVGNFQVCDAISVVNGQAAYTMQVSSVNVSPETANHMIVSLNGIIQAPGSSYTVSGSTITFASNLVTGDVINFIHILGSVLDLGVPSNDTVGAAQIKDDLISGTTALASEPADTDEFLVSDAGTLKRIDYSLIKGGGITGADQWRQTANLSGNVEPITANLERNDTAGYGSIGSAMTVSSGIFTFPSTGIWRVEAVFAFYANASTDGNMYGYIQSTQNNSSYIDQVEIHMFAAANDNGVSVPGYFMFDVTDTSTHKVRFTQKNFGNTGDLSYGNTDRNMTYFTFTRLGDT
jgi:hypothetical protein